MRKKNFSVIAFLQLLCVLIFACQPEGNAIESIRTSTQAANTIKVTATHLPATVKAESDENNQLAQIDLEFWHPFSGGTAEVITELVQQFNFKHRDEIEIIVSSHADMEIMSWDLQESFEAGDNPDIILASSQEIKNLHVAGYIRTIDDLVELSEQKNYFQSIFPVFWNVDEFDGKRIGLPFVQNGHFLFYNKSWSEALGFRRYPQSVEEFSEQACAAFEENLYDDDLDNNGTGGYIYPQGAIPIFSWMSAFGGEKIFTTKDEVILTEEENKQAFLFLYELYLDDCAWTGKEQSPYRYFSERFALLYGGTMEDMLVQLSSDIENENLDDWILIPYPSDTDKPVAYFESYSMALGNVTESEAIAAWQFIEWMTQTENHLELIYQTGAFPLTTNEIQQINTSWRGFEVWKESLQFIPFLLPVPQSTNWYITEKILSDVGWQIIQFTVGKGDIPNILSEAEKLVNSWE